MTLLRPEYADAELPLIFQFAQMARNAAPEVEELLGLTLYLQSEKPQGDKAANWLPSPAGQDFFCGSENLSTQSAIDYARLGSTSTQ